MKRKYSVNNYSINKKVKSVDILFQGNPPGDNYIQDLLIPYGLPCCNIPTIQALNLIQQGTKESQRIGNKIVLDKLHLKLYLHSYEAWTSVSYIRFAIVYDRNVNGVYALPSDIYSDLLQDGTLLSGNFDSQVNVNNTERFDIIYDSFLSLPPVITGGVGQVTGPTTQNTFVIDKCIDLPQLETLYLGNTLVSSALQITQVTTGALYILVWGDVDIGQNPWIVQGTTRVEFRDC